MITTFRVSLAVMLAVLAAACATPPQVVQGTVVRYDAGAKILVMTDERSPERQLSLSLEGAEIGAEPSPGDTVRVAFRESGAALQATRVMNLTRQSDFKGGGGH